MNLSFYERLAKALALQFGKDCEVVVHDLRKKGDPIVAIENGQVSGRKVGDGPSHIVLEAMHAREENQPLPDHLDYLAKAHGGRVLRSSSVFINDENGIPEGIFSINYDITSMLMAERTIKNFLHTTEEEPTASERIPTNVNELLDDLIAQSVALVGKPVALMGKDDKIKAIRFLNQSGAFLVTKSGDKVSKHFGISKYTLYSYIDNKGNQGG